MNSSIYAYPWNFSADNYLQKTEEILALGMQGINLAASYHAGKFIHPSSHHRVYFPEDGVVYFRPRARYGKIKPVLSNLLEREDILALLTKRHELRVNAWMVLLHNTRFGMLYPHTTVENAFGNRYVYSLCPAHPEARHYALTLCHDLAEHYPVRTLLLETPGYLAYSHGFHHEFAQLQPDSWLEAWLGLCFCDHCMTGAKQAGIDSAALRRQGRAAVDEHLNGKRLPSGRTALNWLENDAGRNDDLRAFLQWRCDVVTSLVEDIRSRVRAEVQVKIITTTQKSHTTSVLEGHELTKLCRVADGLETPLYQPSADAVENEGKYIIRQTGGTERVSPVLRPGWPDMQNREQVRDTLARVQALGFCNIDFYNYDLLPPINLQWLKKALNY